MAMPVLLRFQSKLNDEGRGISTFSMSFSVYEPEDRPAPFSSSTCQFLYAVPKIAPNFNIVLIVMSDHPLAKIQ